MMIFAAQAAALIENARLVREIVHRADEAEGLFGVRPKIVPLASFDPVIAGIDKIVPGTGSTYKAGLVWAPTGWLTLRGTNGTSYRAPAVFEQYLGPTSGFISLRPLRSAIFNSRSKK